VQDCKDEINRLAGATAANIIRIGALLDQVNDTLPHGQWGDWLKAEFPWLSETRARNWMNVAREHKSATVAESTALTQLLETSPAAAYVAVQPSTPAPAQQEILIRSAAGEKVTQNKAREIIKSKLEVTVTKSTLAVRKAKSPQPDPLEDAYIALRDLLLERDHATRLAYAMRYCEDLRVSARAFSKASIALKD
jgi:hypothetical protein